MNMGKVTPPLLPTMHIFMLTIKKQKPLASKTLNNLHNAVNWITAKSITIMGPKFLDMLTIICITLAAKPCCLQLGWSAVFHIQLDQKWNEPNASDRRWPIISNLVSYEKFDPTNCPERNVTRQNGYRERFQVIISMRKIRKSQVSLYFVVSQIAAQRS